MKKPFLLTLTILLINISIYAQLPNKSDKLLEKVKTDSGWRVTTQSPSGNEHVIRYYSDDSCKIKNGITRYFNKDGNLLFQATYVNDKLEGTVYDYYTDSGRLRKEEHYKNDKLEGETTAWYFSGKLAGKATYKEGEQLSGTFYNEDGTINKKAKIMSKEASFPGGQPGLQSFLHDNLKYPKKAINKEIQGIVVLSFTVTSKGKVTDLQIARSVNKLLDKEAMRVGKLMPDWEPAIFAGKPTDSDMEQPIVFQLEDQQP